MAKKKNLEEKKPTHKINWYEDKYQSVLVWRNWLFVITITCLLGVSAVCGILYFMLPLKSVAPFVIQIDEKSGLSQVVNQKTYRDYSANEMLIKYFAMQYISARENYDINSFKNSMEMAGMMSSADVRYALSMLLKADNVESPLNKFRDSINRYSDLISFSILSTNEASGESIIQARLRIREVKANGAPEEYFEIVTISCYFEKNLDLNEKERLINPLGFIVTSYKVDKEIQGGK